MPKKYRIFIASVASTLDETRAKSAASSLYQAICATRNSALHTLTLSSGMTDYTDAVLSSGNYKVYVLTMGKSGFASRLSIVSGNVTLD